MTSRLRVRLRTNVTGRAADRSLRTKGYSRCLRVRLPQLYRAHRRVPLHAPSSVHIARKANPEMPNAHRVYAHTHVTYTGILLGGVPKSRGTHKFPTSRVTETQYPTGFKPLHDPFRDNKNRMLLPQQFRRSQQKLGRTFDFDAHCTDGGENSHVSRWCSPTNSFMDTNVAEITVWDDPSYDDPTPFLQHYWKCKEKAPTPTNAVLLLHQWKSAPWWYLTKGF